MAVELRFGTPTFTIAATMYPQGNRQFGVSIARFLGPYIQVKAILTEGSLITVTPLCVVATPELDVLIAGMLKTVAELNTLPRFNRLWSLPTVLADRRSCIRNATENKYILYILRMSTIVMQRMEMV